MKSSKSNTDKGSCVPIRLFKFPGKDNQEMHTLSTQNSFSKMNTSFSRQNSLNLIKSTIYRNHLQRSYSSKICKENYKLGRHNYSFIDLGLEEKKINKSNISIMSFTPTGGRKNKFSDDRVSSSVSVDSNFKNPVINSPTTLLVRPHRTKKIEKSPENLMQDWIISLSKPLNKIFISRSSKQIKVYHRMKPKKTLQAWIPQPSNSCKSPFSVRSDSLDQS